MVLLEQINKESFQVRKALHFRIIEEAFLFSVSSWSFNFIFVFIWFVERLSQLMHFSHSAEQLSIISKSFLTESQSNFRSISENVIFASDVLSPRWLGPGSRGGWGGGGQ